MKNILVFPCGTEIGLEIHRALAGSKFFNVIGASSVDDHGVYVYDNYFGNIPFVDSPDFLSSVNTLIDQQNIDYIVPAHDSVVLKLAQLSELLNAEVIGSQASTCEICRSKSKTYQALDGIVATPKVYAEVSQADFPLFLKPDVGEASRGVKRVENARELDFYLANDPTLLTLEYLPGKEYTVDCFTDRHGQLRFAGARERSRIAGGISVHSYPVEIPVVQSMALSINSKLQLRGAWFFQVKERANGELVLMEVAPRIAGTMAMYRADGINFIELALFDRQEYDVEIIHNRVVQAIDRSLSARFSLNYEYDSVYVDLDDTLIVAGQVNAQLISFLYQAKNERKRLILVTKHKYSVELTLAKYAICAELFDQIIHLRDVQEKRDFINAGSAIFIDDSFSERLAVYRHVGIPVFSIDAVEALLH